MSVIVLDATMIGTACGNVAWVDWQMGCTTVLPTVCAMDDAMYYPHKRPLCDD